MMCHWKLKLKKCKVGVGVGFAETHSGNIYMQTDFPHLLQIWQYSESDPGHVNSTFHLDIVIKAFERCVLRLTHVGYAAIILVLGAFFGHVSVAVYSQICQKTVCEALRSKYFYCVKESENALEFPWYFQVYIYDWKVIRSSLEYQQVFEYV